MMVEVFKTNIEDPLHAHMLIEEIHGTYSEYQANFDLEDCDRILRIEGNQISPDLIIQLLHRKGYECHTL